MLVVRRVVEQHETLTVSRAPRFKNAAVICGTRRALQRENNVLVQNIEVPVGAIRHRAAVERLAHEHKIPFAAADFVDDVFPALRRQTLTEIRAQTVNALVSLIRRRAVRATGFVEPIKQAVGKITPDVLRNLVEMAVTCASAVFIANGVIKPIALGGIISSRRRIRHECGVTAKINIRHVAPFSEIKTVGRLRHCRRAGRALIVFAGARIKPRLGRADQIRRLRVRLEIINAARIQLRIPRGMIERFVEHHVLARRIRRRDEVGKFSQRRVTRVRLAQQRIHLKKVFYRIRTADGIRRAGVRIVLTVQNSDGMNRLKPQPVHAEIFGVSQIETVGHRVERPRAGAAI